MYIDRILYPVTSLGPGRRIALWVAGCSRHCAHCANPELWQRHEQQKITPQKLAAAVRGAVQGTVDGITISGGEPFEQAQELTEFLDALSFRGGCSGFHRIPICRSAAAGSEKTAVPH